MGNHAISSETVFPTANDIGASSGDGNKLNELSLAPWLGGTDRNYVYGGFLIPDSSANLDISMPGGIAWITGYRVNVPGSTTVTCANSATNYIFLVLTRDGSGKVDGAIYTVNTTGTYPSNSIMLSVAIAAGGAITNTMDVRMCVPLSMSPYFGIADTVSGSTGAINSHTLHTSNTTIGGANLYKAFRLKAGVTLTANMPIVMIVSETVIDIGGLITTVGAGPAGAAVGSPGGTGSPGTDQGGGGGGGDGTAAEGGRGGEVRSNGIVLETSGQSTNAGVAGIQVAGSKMMRNMNFMSGLSGGSGGGGGAPGTAGAGGPGGGSIVLIAPIIRLRAGSELRTSGQSGSNAVSSNAGGGGGGGAGNIWIHARLTFYTDEGCTFTMSGGAGGGRTGVGGIGGAGADGLKQIMLYG